MKTNKKHKKMERFVISSYGKTDEFCIDNDYTCIGGVINNKMYLTKEDAEKALMEEMKRQCKEWVEYECNEHGLDEDDENIEVYYCKEDNTCHDNTYDRGVCIEYIIEKLTD